MTNPPSAGISSLPVTASPNPFRGTTTIGYCLPERTFATLEIYNVAGQAVAKLVNGTRSEGGHSISWDGLDFVGRPLQPGVYFARLQIAGHVATKPIVLIR